MSETQEPTVVVIEEPAPIGHNSGVNQEAAARLRNLVERTERLIEERKALSDDITDIYREAKSAGFDPKVMRHVIALRRKEPSEIEEERNLTDLYLHSLGM